MTRAWKIFLWIGGALALVAVLYHFPDRTIAPGDVREAHAALQKNCFACHDLFHGASPEKCRACHVFDAGEIMRTPGGSPRKTPFHQALAEKNCLACHSEHAGTSVYRAKTDFSHELLQPQVQAQCQSCHRKPEDLLHRNAPGGCSECHTQSKWRETTFDHAKFFALDPVHNVPCGTCHTQDFKSYSCFGCHEHRREKIVVFHKKRGIRNIDDCIGCHKSAHEKPDD